MKVEVLFKSHRYEEFDSSTQTCSEPYRGKGLNVLTDWNLYLGSLEENGIILVQHWYDGNPASSQGKVTLEGVEVPASVRKVGCAMSAPFRSWRTRSAPSGRAASKPAARRTGSTRSSGR